MASERTGNTLENKQKHVCVIGAGLTGLTTAYRLSKKGYKVTVLECNLEPGGMASAFSIGREKLEHIYHHIFTSDTYVTSLADELGLSDKMQWFEPKDSLYMAGKLYPFSSPVDLIRFKPIPFVERIRTGLAVLKAKKVDDISRLEEMTAKEWLVSNSGQKAYDSLWDPLLRSKFDNDASRVSAVWIWNKFKLRGNSRGSSVSKEMLGYMDGSFKVLIDALVEAIRKNGGELFLGYTVFGLTKLNGHFRIACMLEDCSSVELEADAVAATISTPRFNAMTGELGLPKEYLSKTSSIQYKGDLCMVMRLRHRLSDYYWTTVCDDLPFVVVVEHTNLTGLRKYGGHIVYLSRYLDITDPLWTQSDSDIFKLFCKGLANMYPDFRPGDVRDWRLTRTRYAQPVIGKKYSEKMPAMSTPQPGIFLAGMAQIYPEDRGMNYAIRLGDQAAEAVSAHLEGSDSNKANCK
ncbi:MAG: NAD(P)/FAD-dependent oxidoreductase [Saccharofermentanales bacterium]